MKKILLLLLLICSGLALTAQKKAEKKYRFPADFAGRWKGNLQWSQPGKKEPVNVNMELNILPADSALKYSWQLVYGQAGEDNRPYILRAVDTAKGHWVVDELNGIVLDQYWTGQKFCGAFTVQNSTIVNNYWIENGQLVVEFISLVAKPIATTGNGTEESPKVDSYRVSGYQRALLSRLKGK